MEKSVAEVGEEIYQELKDELEREHLGKIVAICDAGVASIGDEVDEVLDRALEKSTRTRCSMLEGWVPARLSTCFSGYMKVKYIVAK